MPSRHATRLALPLLVTALLVLSGCGSKDDGPTPLGDGSASPSPSPSASPTVPAGVPTEPPAEPSGMEETVASAKAYGEYVARVADYVSESHDTAVFDDIAVDVSSCSGCAFATKYADRYAKKKQFTVGPDLEVTRSVAQPVSGQKGIYQVVTLFDYPAKALVAADGKVLDDANGNVNPFYCSSTLVWQGDGWKVKEFQFSKASGGKS